MGTERAHFFHLSLLTRTRHLLFSALQLAAMTDTEACIAINMIPKMGPVRLRKLLEIFETPQRVLSAKSHELRGVEGIGKEVAETIPAWETHVDLEAELKRIADFGARDHAKFDRVSAASSGNSHRANRALRVG